MKKITWIPEAEAAKMMNYKPETLRKYAKSGKLTINFTARNQRRYQYNKNDIEKVLLEHSTMSGRT